MSKNLFQRMRDAAAALPGGVHKDVEVTFGERYKAVGHGQVVERSRKALLDAGVLYFVQTLDSSEWDKGKTATGKDITVFFGDFDVVFVNVDAPDDRYAVRIRSQAFDTQDKAFPKASSYAKKLAVMQALQLFGDDDAIDEDRVPDNVEPVGRKSKATKPPAAEPPQQRQAPTFKELVTEGARSGGITENMIRLYLLHTHGLAPGAKVDDAKLAEAFRDAWTWIRGGGLLQLVDEISDAGKVAMGGTKDSTGSLADALEWVNERMAEVKR